MRFFRRSKNFKVKIYGREKFFHGQFKPAKISKSKFRQNKKNFLTLKGLYRIEKNFFLDHQGFIVNRKKLVRRIIGNQRIRAENLLYIYTICPKTHSKALQQAQPENPYRGIATPGKIHLRENSYKSMTYNCINLQLARSLLRARFIYI
jgi:hypothetical protein